VKIYQACSSVSQPGSVVPVMGKMTFYTIKIFEGILEQQFATKTLQKSLKYM